MATWANLNQLHYVCWVFCRPSVSNQSSLSSVSRTESASPPPTIVDLRYSSTVWIRGVRNFIMRKCVIFELSQHYLWSSHYPRWIGLRCIRCSLLGGLKYSKFVVLFVREWVTFWRYVSWRDSSTKGQADFFPARLLSGMSNVSLGLGLELRSN